MTPFLIPKELSKHAVKLMQSTATFMLKTDVVTDGGNPRKHGTIYLIMPGYSLAMIIPPKIPTQSHSKALLYYISIHLFLFTYLK